MVSAKTLLLGTSLFAYTLAQTRIAFTSVPALAVAGESYNITWAGGDDSPVTVTLRQGDPDDLTTVATLADGVTEDFFVWNVSRSLPTASDYALQITQGQDEINYSGLFSIAGGSGTSTISYSGTITATASSNATASVISTTSSFASFGTGTALPRNTTFSSATISSTSSLPPGSTQHMTLSSTTEAATSTAASQTAAATTSAPDSNAGAGQLGSSVALVMGVFAAVMCLS